MRTTSLDDLAPSVRAHLDRSEGVRDNQVWAGATSHAGDGIPERLRTHVLDPFVRVEDNHPQPGTGIGLALVHRFAELHGGGVEIGESEQGGARVSVTLPDTFEPVAPAKDLALV